MTNSIAFPNMFDVARSRVATLEGRPSIVNRTRLLILTEPTSLYNEPNFGVGLSRHLWKYNNENEKAIIRDRIVRQLKLYEPSCDADKTEFADGLLFTEKNVQEQLNDPDHLKMTVALHTIYGDDITVETDI